MNIHKLYDHAAEEAVIGILLAHPHQPPRWLAAEDFYVPGHQRLFRALPDLTAVPPSRKAYEESPLIPTMQDMRIREAARYADVPEMEVRRLVENRPADFHLERKAVRITDLAGIRGVIFDAQEARLYAAKFDPEAVQHRVENVVREMGLE